MSFDELEGGAIRTDTRYYENAPPREDYTTVLRGAEISKFEGGNPSAYFNSAFDMIPKNLYPMFQYDTLMQAEDPSLLKSVLLKSLSGFGAHRDASHIQKAVVHSLKKYPKLLHMYLNSRNLIMAT